MQTIGDLVETARYKGTFSYEWRILDFLSLDSGRYISYRSPVFNFCNTEWYLQMDLHGPWNKSLLDWVYLTLVRLKHHTPITLNVTLGIKGAKGLESRREMSLKISDGWNKLYGICTKSMLSEHQSRLMPGNVFIIALGITPDLHSITLGPFKTVEQCKEAEEKQGVEELQKSLKELLVEGKDSDILIKVQDKEIPAHRIILQARSTVFQAMFTHDMVEKQSRVVTVEDCDLESFPAFLEHIYTGSTKMISIDNVFGLYFASDKYNLSALKKACTSFVKRNLTVSCFCHAITLSLKHDAKELIECATEFFCRNALQILKTEEWQTFLKENMTVGNELLIKAFSK